MAISDPDCSPWLILAGSTSAAGCMHVYPEMVRTGMIDVVVATGAAIVDMDFFEALGFRHYQAAGPVDDNVLRSNYIDRIYDTYIDEEELQACDATIYEIAERLEPRPYSSREFIHEMGKWLAEGHAKKPGSLIQTAYEEGAPIFCPAFVDSSAGFGLVKHQKERIAAKKPYVSIDAVADFRELTDIKIAAGTTGLFMVGGGCRRTSPRTPWSAPRSSASRPTCTNTRCRSPWPTCATAPARPRRCRRPPPGARCRPPMSRWCSPRPPTVVPLIASDAYHRGPGRAARSGAGPSCSPDGGDDGVEAVGRRLFAGGDAGGGSGDGAAGERDQRAGRPGRRDDRARAAPGLSHARGHPDASLILPPPPVPGTDRYEQDRRVYGAIQGLRDTPRWRLAQADNAAGIASMMEHFSCAVGVTMTPEAAPRLAAMMRRVSLDHSRIVNDAKNGLRRQRPFLIDAGEICIARNPSTDNSFDYPSGTPPGGGNGG